MTSADQQIQTLVDALVATGWNLWLAAHNNTPAAQRLCRWMQALAPGQLVLEVTTARTEHPIERVGTLLAITSSHEYTIRTIDGREHRWENAEFVRIPGSSTDSREIFLLGEPRA